MSKKRQDIDRIFVAYKPSGIGSNQFLGRLKYKYNANKGGFSGTLDPFAKGVLIVAFGRYTKLFSHLKKTPKKYRATLWLGAHSQTLDIDAPVTFSPITTPPSIEAIKAVLQEHIGMFHYTPPKFCAKRVDGVRAYELARKGEAVVLEKVSASIYTCELVTYNFPFVTFEAQVSEGTYIRSLGESIAHSLGTVGILSMLERLYEGVFVYEGEKALSIEGLIDAPYNYYLGDLEDLSLGKKIDLSLLQTQEDGKYMVRTGEYLAIISITNGQVSYLLNKVPLC